MKTTLLAVMLGMVCLQQYQMLDKKRETPKPVVIPNAVPLYSDKDEDCLAKNIYYEAGIEAEAGKYAVAQVTMNRLASGRWGKTVCEVVFAKAQFSWTKKKKLEKPKGNAWMDSQWVAHRVLRGDTKTELSDAMFYHASYVNPYWKNTKAKIMQVGTHIFYSRAKTV